MQHNHGIILKKENTVLVPVANTSVWNCTVSYLSKKYRLIQKVSFGVVLSEDRKKHREVGREKKINKLIKEIFDAQGLLHFSHK